MGAFDRFAVKFEKGKMIFCEYEPGNSFYLIQQGRVQISKVLGEIEKMIDVLQPGELFGEMAILEEAPRSASAIALDDVVCLEFNRANFAVLMEGNPQIAMKLLKTFVKRIYDQRRRLMILTLPDAVARVCDVFIMLDEARPAPVSGTEKREFPATVEDVAHWAGIPAEKARTVINQLVGQRRLELYPNKIVVNNIHDVQRLVATRRKEA